jgi:Na+/proline symporter
VYGLVAAAYVLVLLGIGARKARQVRSQEDFSLAGRRLGATLLAGTLLATWIGTGSIFGNAEETGRVGVAAFLLPLSGAVGILVLWLLAARIRSLGQFTIQDVLEARFGVVPRILGTLTLLFAYTIIVSYQYRAGAAILERTLPGLGHGAAVALVAAVVILYTALAGMLSVARTDLANGVLMTAGILTALVVLAWKAGGPGSILEALPEGKRRLLGTYGAAEMASVLLPALLLILGDANMVQRFFSARDPATARRAAAGMFFGVLLLETAIVALALVSWALVTRGVLPSPAIPGHIIVQAAYHALPPALGALLVASILAVVVSTADSYLLAPATALVRDVYDRFLRRGAAGAESVPLGRAVVVFLGLVALGLSYASDRFFSVALFAYTIYGVGITPVLLAAYFWRGATAQGATASMLVGVGSAVLWKAGWLPKALALLLERGGWETAAAALARGEVGAVLPSSALGVLALVGVSFATAPRRPSASS